MDPVDSEFSRPVAVDSLDTEESHREIDANELERTALAARFGLVALNRLRASLDLARPRPGLVELRGRLRAEVVQTCVVSLEDFTSNVEAEVALTFTDQPEDAAEGDEFAEDFEDLDAEPPEPIVDGMIDIGETVAQQLFLNLDSFPRAPGIEFSGYRSDPDPETANQIEVTDANPFAKLAELKEKL